MEIFKTFGFDPLLTAAQIVNFLVILFILKKFLYKPLFNVLKKREDLVKNTVKQAEESKKTLEKAQNEEKEIIKKAKVTASQMLKDANEQAAATLRKAEESAKKQTTKMINDAKDQIALETKAAEKQLTQHVSRLSVEILKKSVENIFTPTEQEQIVKRALQQLQKQSN